jgi:hypothetical protein
VLNGIRIFSSRDIIDRCLVRGVPVAQLEEEMRVCLRQDAALFDWRRGGDIQGWRGGGAAASRRANTMKAALSDADIHLDQIAAAMHASSLAEIRRERDHHPPVMRDRRWTRKIPSTIQGRSHLFSRAPEVEARLQALKTRSLMCSEMRVAGGPFETLQHGAVVVGIRR